MDTMIQSASTFFDTSFNASSPPSPSAYYQTLPSLDHFSYIERLWASWYLLFSSPALATGVLLFLSHELVYFGRSAPCAIIDAIPYFRRWKLQPTKIPTLQSQWHCTKLVLLSHFLIELPLIGGFHSFTTFLGLQTYQLPFPSWTKIALQLALFFLIEDTVHYFAHRALHTPRLYKMIHKVHHEYPAPFGLTAEYAHPLEVLILGSGTLGGPLVYCALTQDLHLFTVLLWMTLRLCQAVEAHSGYDFPWSLRHFLPFWAGAEHHDYHHMAFVNNFSSSFRHWDSLFGTDTRYHAYRARIDAAKKEDREKVQRESDEQALLEGEVAANEVLARAERVSTRIRI